MPIVVDIAFECDGCDALTNTCGLFCTIVVDCGIDTVRKTVPPELVGIVAVVLPFNRDLARDATVDAAVDCTMDTLIGVTLVFGPEVRCCTTLWLPLLMLLLLVSKLAPA